MIYLIWLHKTAFCSKLAWQARGGDHALRTWFLFCCFTEVFQLCWCASGNGPCEPFQSETVFVMRRGEELEVLTLACMHELEEIQVLPKKLAVPIRMLAVHLSWHFTQCLFSKPKKYKLLSLGECTYYPSPGWNDPAAWSSIKLLSKSWWKEKTFPEGDLGGKLYDHFSK